MPTIGKIAAAPVVLGLVAFTGAVAAGFAAARHVINEADQRAEYRRILTAHQATAINNQKDSE